MRADPDEPLAAVDADFLHDLLRGIAAPEPHGGQIREEHDEIEFVADPQDDQRRQ